MDRFQWWVRGVALLAFTAITGCSNERSTWDMDRCDRAIQYHGPDPDHPGAVVISISEHCEPRVQPYDPPRDPMDAFQPGHVSGMDLILWLEKPRIVDTWYEWPEDT